jgi:hypothetical protein
MCILICFLYKGIFVYLICSEWVSEWLLFNTKSAVFNHILARKCNIYQMSKKNQRLVTNITFPVINYCRPHLSKISAVESLLLKLDNLYYMYNYQLYTVFFLHISLSCFTYAMPICNAVIGYYCSVSICYYFSLLRNIKKVRKIDGTFKSIRAIHGIRPIRVRGTEVWLYIFYHNRHVLVRGEFIFCVQQHSRYRFSLVFTWFITWHQDTICLQNTKYISYHMLIETIIIFIL